VFGMTSPAADILSRCRDAIKQRLGPRPQMTVFGRTGYAVIRDPGAGGCMIFDCGPLGPDYQPGHGHCDILSYELSLHSRRVIVDTGVSTYERGEDRHYERSTAAHNTVRVDGKDQAEIWASFRVGRRPKIGAIESGVLAGCRFVRAEYSGCQAPGVVHRRTIYHIPQRSWLVVDSLRGKGRHRIESFIHFHPGVVIEPCDERPERNGDITRRRLIRFGSYSYWLMVAGEGDVRLRQSWYSPEFGLRQRRSTVHWSLEGLLPAFMIYGFVPADGGPVTFRKNNDAESIQINQFTLPLA
ncbi:MAG: heparinase II/III family protein, partial [Terriglobia bacterium]